METFEPSNLQALIERIAIVAQEPMGPVIEEYTSNKKALDHLQVFANAVLLSEKDASISPMFVLSLPNNELIPLVMPMEDDYKDTAASLVRTLGIVTKAVRYTQITEAWCKSVQQEDFQAFKEGKVQVRDCQDKTEVVILLAGDSEETIMRTLEIVRDWNTGAVTELKLLHDDIPAQGRFANLLQDA